MVPRSARSRGGLAVASPEQEAERQEDGPGEPGRQGDPVRCSPRTAVGPWPSSSRAFASAAPELVLGVDRAAREPLRRRRGCRASAGPGCTAARDRRPSKTRSSGAPDVDEDRVDARRPAEGRADLRAGDGHALAVGEHDQQPLAGRRREVAAADDGLERRQRVAVETKDPCGGGRSIPIERRSVATKTSSSMLGKRCGRTRSVNEAIPNGTSGNAVRKRIAASFARSYRIAARGLARASIDRDVSRTTIASASARTRRSDVHSTRGCAAARPSRSAATASPATGSRLESTDGSGSPSDPLTLAPRRRTSRFATSGSTAPRASSTPSGVNSVKFMTR